MLLRHMQLQIFQDGSLRVYKNMLTCTPAELLSSREFEANYQAPRQEILLWSNAHQGSSEDSISYGQDITDGDCGDSLEEQ
jgi:hypothetical protein